MKTFKDFLKETWKPKEWKRETAEERKERKRKRDLVKHVKSSGKLINLMVMHNDLDDVDESMPPYTTYMVTDLVKKLTTRNPKIPKPIRGDTFRNDSKLPIDKPKPEPKPIHGRIKGWS